MQRLYLWFPKTYDFFPASDTATKIAVLIPGGYYNYLQVIADSAFNISVYKVRNNNQLSLVPPLWFLL